MGKVRRIVNIVAGILFAVGFLAAGVVWFYVQRGVRVQVRNMGATTLRGVIVHVRGNSYPLGDLQSQQSISTGVQPKGESSVEIEFTDARGKQITQDVDTYIEARYYFGTIAVDLNDRGITEVTDSVNGSLFSPAREYAPRTD
jgi:hypothetical protein